MPHTWSSIVLQDIAGIVAKQACWVGIKNAAGLEAGMEPDAICFAVAAADAEVETQISNLSVRL